MDKGKAVEISTCPEESVCQKEIQKLREDLANRDQTICELQRLLSTCDQYHSDCAMAAQRELQQVVDLYRAKLQETSESLQGILGQYAPTAQSLIAQQENIMNRNVESLTNIQGIVQDLL